MWDYHIDQRDEIRRFYITAGPYQPRLSQYKLSGNDESIDSLNRGNFIEMVKLLATYDKNVANVVLENAPGNAQYISPSVQKEILYIFARRIRAIIREDIDNAKYCIIIDESRDESKREQMSIVLRFKFFDLVHVSNTTALTLKEEITSVLSQHNLNICNIRGQEYDGASNMRGEWNGLQALFLKECPFAYYIHCLAHRLQLALVAAAREVSSVHQFFSKLTFIVNIVRSSPKRHDQLIEAHGDHIAYLIANDELETGKGLNQQGTLKRAGDTRWGSHLASIQSLLCMYDATCDVLQTTTKEGNYAQRGDADSAYDSITSFEFILILHVMKNILGITHELCQALQRRSQDILNAISLVSTTKILIQKLRESGWETLFNEVKMFCEKHNVEIPDLNAPYFPVRSRRRAHDVSIEHHYRVNLFIAIIDTQLQELNSKFSDSTMELLSLSSTLDPRDNFKLLNVDHICELANKFYPDDFSEQEKLHLRIQAPHYELDVPHHCELKQLSTISELCQGLVKTRKSLTYPLIDRLIRLVLTLPVSTATSERSFSAMKIIKNRLRNRMEDEYLTLEEELQSLSC
ncbi:hypothetical protein K2173_016865 [Erythroxylum novogranatense]|uniref:Zinc finger MYM-type protein 1-like n=1 Tax=Erythroxylum novogranatense TaxID=1862640 RepID=A0AAV8U8L3_9ROSI|nr:hypothetical protein K2173_016865 [Erythroxylum novogranatense]